MSTNLGTILVGLGYDLSALERGSPEAFRLINSQTLGMSAEMKRASREGAESFRLIDEALGIHLSRPLTRILTQEFPSLAKGLQAVLGVGVVGALGIAGVELFDKISSGIEKARKAQEAWSEATVATQKLMASGSDHYAESIETVRAKLAAAQNDPGPLHQLEQMRELGKNVEETRKLVDQLGEAMMKEAKAAEEAGNISTRAYLGVIDAGKSLLQGLGQSDPLWGHISKMLDTSDQSSQLKSVFASMKDNIDEAFEGDKIKGTHEALRMVAEDLKTANFELQFMKDNGNAAGAAIADQGIRFLTTTKQWIEGLNTLNEQTKKLQQQNDANEAAKKALEAQHEAIRLLQGDLKGWNDEANKGLETWIRINAELEKAMGSLSDSALPAGGKRFEEASKIFFPAMSQVGPPPGAPQLADQVELEKVTSDQNEAWKKAGEIVASLETPLQKYSAQLAVIKELQNEGRITTAQFAQAQQNLQEQLAQAQQRMEKLLKEGGAMGGLQAFMMQMQGQGTKGGAGQFTFDLLNKGLQGFEDETVKALTGAKTNWAGFFESLDQMALKFMLNGMISQLLKGFSSGGGTFASIGSLFGLGGGTASGASGAASAATSAASGVASATQATAMTAFSAAAPIFATAVTLFATAAPLFSTAVPLFATAAPLFTTAVSIFLTSATELSVGAPMLLAASTLLMTAASMQLASHIAGAAGGAAGLVGEFASGTDYAPGGLSLVGENGPELMNVPAGASITPNGMLRGHTINLSMPIDARGAEIGVEEKIARALSAAAPQMIMRAVVEASELQRRTPR